MTASRQVQRTDRDEVFVEYTKSICPVCKVVVDAEVNVRENKVFLRKRCRDHGGFEALLYSDAEMYMASLRFNKPGTFPLETQTEVRDGCPLDCGLCPDHKQHACLGIIEVNSGCNLDCPVCFADSGHQPDGFSLTPRAGGSRPRRLRGRRGRPRGGDVFGRRADHPPADPRLSPDGHRQGRRAWSRSTPTASAWPTTGGSWPPSAAMDPKPADLPAVRRPVGAHSPGTAGAGPARRQAAGPRPLRRGSAWWSPWSLPSNGA